MGFWDQAQTVHSKQTFIEFMDALLQDWRNRHEMTRRNDGADIRFRQTPWKNCHCPDFLEEMRARIADSTQLPSDFPYKELAGIMTAAAGDEQGRREFERRQKGRLNCWEFMKCGREPGGEKASELGVCLAAVWEVHKGMHGGRYGGRMCWALVGTLCGGKVQGTFAEKIDTCTRCDFYQYVRQQEGKNFRHALPNREKVGCEG